MNNDIKDVNSSVLSTVKPQGQSTQGDRHCDNCSNAMTPYQYKKGKGLCLPCIDAIN